MCYTCNQVQKKPKETLMKFLRNLFIFLIVLIILVFAGGVIFLKSFDINRYRDRITAEIKKSIGRDVTLSGITLNLSLFDGVVAEIQGLKINEDPAFGTDDFLSVGTARLNVDAMSYLTRHEIIISKIAVSGLNIRVIKNRQGIINAQKIGPPSIKGPESAQSPSNPAATASPAGLPALTVKTIEFSDGKVVYTDQGFQPALNIVVSRINFTVENFSLNAPFIFKGHMGILGETKNLDFSGRAKLDLSSQQADLSDVHVSLDLSGLNIPEMIRSFPPLEASGLKDRMEGTVSVQIPSLSAGVKGLGTLNVAGKIENGKFATKFLPAVVEKVNAGFTADSKDINIEKFSLNLLTGTVSGQAKISDYLAGQALSAHVKTEAVPLDSVVAGLPEGMVLKGGVDAQIEVTGQNLSQTQQFLKSLNGTGKFEVKDGKLENFNLLKTLFSRIDFIPGLASIAESAVPGQYQAQLAGNETRFQKLSSSINITGGTVNLPDLQIASELFEADFQIFVDPQLIGNLSGQVKLPGDFSQNLAGQAKPLAYLQNSDGNIVMPLVSSKGPLTALKIMPDVKNVVKNAIEGEGVRQLDKLLNKVLKTDDSGQQDSGSGEGEGTSQSPAKELIHGVLDKILK